MEVGVADEKTLLSSLDDYFSLTNIGSLDAAIGNDLYGINHRQTPGMVPTSRDKYGLTFFTRPQLNLQSDNLRNMRKFYRLLDSSDDSINRIVRALLDPRTQVGYEVKKGVIEKHNCNFVNERNVFIPVLTNNLISMSGWPDITVPTFKTQSGSYGESMSFVDGPVRLYDTFTINATFRNVAGDVIMYLFYVWLYYMTYVFEGLILPYPDYMVMNAIDYNTRIYRLVLDRTGRYVTKIAASGPCFPTNLPIGQFFDFNSDRPYNDQTKEFTISFETTGVTYMDEILIYYFNKAVAIFNPSMRNDRRDNSLTQIPFALLSLFKNRGYPRINPDNYELEWWIESTYFKNILSKITNSQAYNPTTMFDYEGD